MTINQKESFFSTHAIIILSLFTYSICDEKVKISPVYEEVDNLSIYILSQRFTSDVTSRVKIGFAYSNKADKTMYTQNYYF